MKESNDMCHIRMMEERHNISISYVQWHCKKVMDSLIELGGYSKQEIDEDIVKELK